jgi:hypothetical protein
MSAQTNKLLVQHIFEALGKGDRSSFLDALHDDLVMQVMGSSSWSQTVHGKRNFLEIFFWPRRFAIEFSQPERSASLPCRQRLGRCRGEGEHGGSGWSAIPE